MQHLLDAWDHLVARGLVADDATVSVWEDRLGNFHRASDCGVQSRVLMPVRVLLATPDNHWCECGGLTTTTERRVASHTAKVLRLQAGAVGGAAPKQWDEMAELLHPRDRLEVTQGWGAEVVAALEPDRRRARDILLQRGLEVLSTAPLERVIAAWSVTGSYDWELDAQWLAGLRREAGVLPSLRRAVLPQIAATDTLDTAAREKRLAHLLELRQPVFVVACCDNDAQVKALWGHAPEAALYLWAKRQVVLPQALGADIPAGVADGLKTVLKHTRGARGTRVPLDFATVAASDRRVAETALRLWCDENVLGTLNELLETARRL